MAQLNKINSTISISWLTECFFILGFTLLTYKYNVYIAFGILPVCFILMRRMYVGIAFIVILLLTLSFVYYVYDGTAAAFRVIKTMIILLPLYYTNSLVNTSYKLSNLFRGFMTVNALLVCIDFVLYFTLGRTIMSFTESGFMPRPCGLLEDSNFFSYLMLVTIFYYRWQDGKYTKLFILSLLLSGSFSAIAAFAFLSFMYLFVDVSACCRFRMRMLLIIATILVIFIYDWIAIHPDEILTFISGLDINALIKIKLTSMTHRFNTVSNAMGEIDSVEEILMGIGAGKTRELSDIGLNLHNSFLQMFLEMGGVLSLVVLSTLLYMVWHIRQTRYVILFCVILMLSCIMETFYNPLLSFIYFVSFLDRD